MPVSSRWVERFRRLAGMGWGELYGRTRQEFAKRSDFILGEMGIRCTQDDCTPWSQGSGRFFFWPEQVSEIVDWFREHKPEIVEEIVERAEQICRHRFDLLGYEGLDYGAEIDWHRDAVHDKRAPNVPWFRVRYLDFDQVGDSKVTWELNRHQHLVTLAKAYRLTAEPGYARELFHQWYHWQKKNPYGIGINWASSLEVAFRSLSWLWVWRLLQGSADVPEAFSNDLWRALMLNARHIDRFLSTYFSPNTHLLGEAVGLFFIGTLCPGPQSAQRWQQRGWQIILDATLRQVRPDGMHFEQSLYYHVYALDFFLHARVLAELNRFPVPSTFNRTIESMLNALCSLHKAGPLPSLGDDDGGRVFDGRRNRGEHLTDPLGTGAVLFDRADFKAAASDLCEETVWLLGIEGARRFEKLSLPERGADSFALKQSGIYVMSSSKPTTQQLVISTRPQEAGRIGHSHADAMSVQLSVNRQPILIDTGTYGYVDAGEERDRFRGTGSHNTLQVDGVSQAEPAGPFGWHSTPNVNLQRWISSTSFDFFSGSHDGYGQHGVRHCRSIFFLKPHFWFIRDVVEGDGEHQLDLSWHFAPGTLSPIPGGAAFLGNDPAALTLLFTATQECIQRISQEWHAPVYGKKDPSPLLRFSTRAHLPVEFAALLMPVFQARTQIGVLQPLHATRAGASVKAYQYSMAGSTDYFFFADKGGGWQCGAWASDARFLFCSTSTKENLNRFVMCDGSYLELGEQRMFSAKTAVVCDEWLVPESTPAFVSESTFARLMRPVMNTGTDGSHSVAGEVKLRTV
jgi:hypothetical protein